MLEQVNTSNPIDRFQPAKKLPLRARDEHQNRHGCTPVILSKWHEGSNHAAIETIKTQLSFLKTHYMSIHSLVLIGSTAFSAQTTNSDVDIVVITTEAGHDKVCSFLFAKEIDDSLNGNEKPNFEYTVLTSAHVEELFQTSSPFAYSIRHGIVLRDDGYLLLLRNKRYPRIPEKKYFTTCLYEHIATPYFGLLKKFKAETKKKGCSLACPRKTKGCKGLQSAQVFANLIVKMLYVTLPARGMIPLTKNDTISFVKMAYGDKGEMVVRDVLSLLREKRTSFCFDEYKLLKEFAVQLYKEILNFAGLDRKVRDILADAARIAKQDYTAISNPSMKNCVV